MEAIDGLRRQKAKDAIDRVLASYKSDSPYVRGSVLRYLRELYPDRAFPMLVEALSDRDFIVRENAADELGELDRLEAIPYLHPLTRDSHPDVREAAETAIEILSGSQQLQV